MATSAFTRRISAGDCVRNVLIALGFTQVPSNIFDDSADSNTAQLRFLLTRAGQNLVREFDWQVLTKEQTITTVVGEREYELPVDFDRYAQDASWNRTTRLPVVGSLTEQEWQMLVARQLQGTTFTMLYRIIDDEVVLYNTPSTAQKIVLPYISRGWVVLAEGGYADNIQNDADLCLFDRQLIEATLRLEWDVEKKFDTTASALAYNRALMAAKSKDRPGRTLTLNQTATFPYLGVVNMPDTGYGRG